jgi:hypothetical protein
MICYLEVAWWFVEIHMCVFTLLIAKMFVGVGDLKEMQWGSFIDAICISDRAKHQFKLTDF